MHLLDVLEMKDSVSALNSSVTAGTQRQENSVFTYINRAPCVLFLPTGSLQSVCSGCSPGFVGASREEPGQLLVPGGSEVSEAQVFSAGHGVWPVLRHSPRGPEQSSQQPRLLSGDEICCYLGEHSGLTTEL